MSGGGCNKGRPVKIVIINTQYVETDANSFKSVVQKLTGKESDSNQYSATEEEAVAAKVNERGKHNNQKSFEGKSILMRDESFKELDWFLNQMPPINDDLIW